MILGVGEENLMGLKGVGGNVSLHDNENVVEKDVSSPTRDMHGEVVNDTNEIPKDCEHTSPTPYSPPLPFPQRMVKTKIDLQFGKFLEVLKKLYINIPLTEALS